MGSVPYTEALGELQLCMAIFEKLLPGDVNLLLLSNFKGADSESALALRFLHSSLPQCWDFEPQRRPSMRTLLSHISHLSDGTVPATGGNEKAGPNEKKPLPDVSQRLSVGCADNGEGDGSVNLPDGPSSENSLKRKRAGLCTSEHAHDDDESRRVRARLEGSLDGRMRGGEDEERDEVGDYRSGWLGPSKQSLTALTRVFAVQRSESAALGARSHN